MEIKIPEGSVEIQIGLWAYLHRFTFGGQEYATYDIYSAEGYCFWEVNQRMNIISKIDLTLLQRFSN